MDIKVQQKIKSIIAGKEFQYYYDLSADELPENQKISSEVAMDIAIKFGEWGHIFPDDIEDIKKGFEHFILNVYGKNT